MANTEGQTEPVQTGEAAGQRKVELARAVIETDGWKLHRRAQFTDGSVRELAMQWDDVKRVVAFRRDVLTSAVLSVAITDAAAVVVLDERMEGWGGLIDGLPRHFALAPSFAEWLAGLEHEPLSSGWTILFRAQP